MPTRKVPPAAKVTRAAAERRTANGQRTAASRSAAAVKAPTRRQAATKRSAVAGTGDQPTNRRDDIVRAAAETFYRKGYDATTTQDIADTVGMLKGSLYYYITAKEDLLYEIIDEVHVRLASNLDVVAAMAGDPLTRIWALVHHNVIGNAENLINSAVFFRDFGALTGRRRKHIIALRDKGDTMLRELIQEAQAAGAARPGVDAKLTGTAINTMCNALYHWYRPEGALAPEAVAQSFADLAVASICARPSMVAAARQKALATPNRASVDAAVSAR
ncbi:MAG: Transcriptional regulator, TetR family [Ilumatobacteraceae bacterium]|jgi:AcrR family transcriptional regulator|nr:Transcriptional regulator, TetR family [Ilumatobacteraceae bacterium]